MHRETIAGVSLITYISIHVESNEAIVKLKCRSFSLCIFVALNELFWKYVRNIFDYLLGFIGSPCVLW
jgi:hypothetical protein